MARRQESSKLLENSVARMACRFEQAMDAMEQRQMGRHTALATEIASLAARRSKAEELQALCLCRLERMQKEAAGTQQRVQQGQRGTRRQIDELERRAAADGAELRRLVSSEQANALRAVDRVVQEAAMAARRAPTRATRHHR